MRLLAASGKLQLRMLFIALQIVPKARLNRELFLLLSAPRGFLAAAVVDIGRGRVADAFVIALLVVIPMNSAMARFSASGLP